jgi:lysozyme family protein
VKNLFDEAMALTLGHEGAWYDGSDPRDPNPTMYGVTQKVYDNYLSRKKRPLCTVRDIQPDELRDIYSQYWWGTCDEIANAGGRLTALNLFDIAINAGPGVARKLMQRALDLTEDGKIGDVDDDGIIGPLTKRLIARVIEAKGDETLCLWLCMERVKFYSELAQKPRLRPNLASWIHRTVKFYREHVRT